MKIIAKRTGLGNQIIFLQVLKELKKQFFTDSLRLAELGGLTYTEKNHRINYILFGYNVRTFWRERLKNPFGKFYGFRYKFLGRFWGMGLAKALQYNEGLSEFENLRLLFELKPYKLEKYPQTIAFIIGRKREKSYPYWSKLYRLFESYHIRIFDRNIDLPVYINTPSLKNLKDELLKCDCYIAEDTGVMHLADYLELPGLVIFGGTSIIKNRPLNGEVIWKDVDCRPCYEVFNYKNPTRCKRNFECLNIEPIEIYNKFKELHLECLKDNSY